MNELVPVPNITSLSDTRRSARQISRYRGQAQVRTAAIDAEADVAIEKVEALTAATTTGMAAVGHVGQYVRHVETTNPEVSGRLAYLADAHLLAVGDAVQDLRRQLRRL